MLYRVIGGLVPTLLGWCLYSGAIPVGSLFAAHAGLSKDVPASVGEVSARVADLDMDFLTHGSGVDSRIAEAIPRIERKQTADGWTWQMMSGNDVSTELVVTLTPLDGGARTHVETSVRSLKPLSPAWGIAGPAVLAPAFAGGIEAEINPLLPEGERLSEEALRKKRLNSQAMISTVQTVTNPAVVAIQSQKIMEEERQLESDLKAQRSETESGSSAQDVNFRAGKPMVDVSRH